jgi:hypothetical protein
MKKIALMVAMLVGVSACASNVSAGEPNLNALGLGSMSSVSQTSAKQIRGQGAVVWGDSTATAVRNFNFATSNNGYNARGRTIAGGLNVSVANAGGRTVYAGGLSIAGGR